jgi:mannose-1-phosphate guanylyltransferase
LQETVAMGTAGGLRAFYSDIALGEPEIVFVLHFDICSSFPLIELLHQHIRTDAIATVLGKRVFADEAKTYGCLVADRNTAEIVHWAEKPETFVSDLINCGVYLFNLDLLLELKNMPDTILPNRKWR